MPNLSDFVGGVFEIVDSETFTTSGTWTKPVTAKDSDVIVIDLWGAGGGGASYSASGRGAGGGGGGQHRRWTIVSSAVPSSLTVTVGSGGAGVLGTATGGNGGDSTVSGTGIDILAQGGGGGFNWVGGAGGGDIQRVWSGSPSNSNPGTWGGGYSVSTSFLKFVANANHGGGAGGQVPNSSGVCDGGNTFWGGAGGQPMGYEDAVPTESVGLSTFGGDGGAYQTDGSAPGGGGGGAPAANKPGDGARGEVRVYVVRGGLPSDEFVFEV